MSGSNLSTPVRCAVLLGLALGLSAAPATALTADSGAREQGLVALRALDARVAAIGYRLSSANADLCADKTAAAGIAVHDLSQYGGDYRAAAIRAFGLESGPAILAVAPGAPAEQAGLRADDVIVAVNGTPPPAAQAAAGKASFDVAERIATQLEAAFAQGPVTLTVLRGGEARAIAVPPQWICASRFQAIPAASLDAKADGRYVQVTSALASYARDDDELAAVLAHELAHNILRHRVRLDAAGLQRGLFEGLGRNARLIRQTEIEADALSIHLLDRAGYATAAASRFWQRFGREHGRGIFAAATHPNWKKRVAALDQEAARLAAAKQAGEAPVPPLLQAPLPTLN